MKRYLPFALAFLVGLPVVLSSCKKGATIGAVGYEYPDTTKFDTFDFPTAKYFFYGKFDGRMMKWEHELRSKWDTTTRIFEPETDWSQRKVKTSNIYYNFCREDVLSDCGPDSTDSYYMHTTRFIRPDSADMRLIIRFYDCIDPADSNAYWPFNQAIVVQHGANPFTNPEYGRNGVEIEYIDENLDSWKTKPASGQPYDTYFRVTDFYPRDVLVDTLDTFGFYIVEGEFAGRLFNGSQEKVVTDAKFRARLIPREPQL